MTNAVREKYIAGMVLGGVGDAMGFKNGNWEFCRSGRAILDEVKSMGGIAALNIKCPHFMVSDDTVMALATGEALLAAADTDGAFSDDGKLSDEAAVGFPGATVSATDRDRSRLFAKLAEKYVECMKDMDGRSSGSCTESSVRLLKPSSKLGYRIPFNERAGGCGAAMRACPIGLRYSRPEQLEDLIAVSVESGRMTHHHPTGYLGAVAAALFTSFAVQDVPVARWGRNLMKVLPRVLAYVESTGHCVEENKKHWSYFTDQWTKYLQLRKISDGTSDPVFPDPFGFPQRDAFYKSVSFSGWGGSSGHDAPMIAYDALMGAKGDWIELCYRGAIHGGDSDSTAILAATWFGILHGLEPVPEVNHSSLEYRSRLVDVGIGLYNLSSKSN